MIFQWILMLFALLTLLRARRQYTRKRISRSWFFIWSLLWVGIFIAAAMPRTLDAIAGLVGVARGADLFVYLAVLILLTGVFRLLIKVNQVERQITQLVRALALQQADRPKHNGDEKKISL